MSWWLRRDEIDSKKECFGIFRADNNPAKWEVNPMPLTLLESLINKDFSKKINDILHVFFLVLDIKVILINSISLWVREREAEPPGHFYNIRFYIQHFRVYSSLSLRIYS